MERRFSEDTKKDIQEQLFEMIKKSIKDEKGFDKKPVLKEMGNVVNEAVDIVFQFLDVRLANCMSDNEDNDIGYKYVDRYVTDAVGDILESNLVGNVRYHLYRYMGECWNKEFMEIDKKHARWILDYLDTEREEDFLAVVNGIPLNQLIDFKKKNDELYWRLGDQYCKRHEKAEKSLIKEYCHYMIDEGCGDVDIWKAVLYIFLIYYPGFILHSIYRKREQTKKENTYYIQAMEDASRKLLPNQKSFPPLFRRKYEELMKYIGYEFNGRNDEYKLPVAMTPDVLVYLLQYRVDVKDRKGDVQKIVFSELIKSVIEEIQKYKESRKTSVKKLICDWKEQKQFSPQIYVEMGRKLKLGKLDEKSATEIVSRHDTIDEYTGYLVSLAIWKNLTEHCGKHMPSMNDERKTDIYNALGGSIGEIVSLDKYFTGVELAMLADLLYGIVPVMMSASKDKDIVEVLNALTKAIQYMRFDVVYDFYERCFEYSGKSEEIMKMYHEENELYCMRLENYVLQHGTIDESKIGSVSSKNSILFSQIQKSVLVARYFDKVQ